MPKPATSKKLHRLTQANVIAALAFVLIFGAFGIHYLFTSHAAAGLQTSVTWKGVSGKVENKVSSLCVTTPGTSKGSNGTHLQLAACDSRTGEKWTLTWGSGDGNIKNTTVVNGYSQCLDDTDSSTTPNTSVEVWACNGQASSQTWQTGYGDGTIRIHGMCLGTSGNKTGSGATLALMNCTTTPPTPSVGLTAPKSGANVSGTGVAARASASTSAGSISSIRLTINGATLKTCTNASSCAASWNVSKLKNGSYTVGATATASGGGSKATSESVTIKNASPAPKPGSAPQPKSNPAPAHQSSSSTSGPGSASTTNSTSTQKSTVATLTTPNNSSSSTPTSSNPANLATTNNNPASKSSSSAAGPAIIITLLLLAVAAALVVFVRRRQAQKPMAADVDLESANLPVFPREDPAQTAARLNWWQTDQERQQNAQQEPGQNDNNVPDMYAEGRKRLEEEENHNHPEA
ncbi:MAG TPA: RICIN domain-containing protein [Candidatus Saccharimonadales bacterium]|jgi:hypothetical protein